MRYLFFKPRWLGLFLGLLFFGRTEAFQILSYRSEPCHERMLLGTLDRYREPYSSHQDISQQDLLDEFLKRARGFPVPSDSATQGFVRELENRFDLTHYDWHERWLLASFVAGVREPDTDGFAIVSLNKVRPLHVLDSQQAEHFLRRSTVDSFEREMETITEVKNLLLQRVEALRRIWETDAPPIESVRWTFAFYGERAVTIFAPAFELGRLAHLIQDSFSHTIRDEELRILAIANYVDIINENHIESRDGPGHSVRLDRCDVDWNAFDAMRVKAASQALAEFLREVYLLLIDSTRPMRSLQVSLNMMFLKREGCDDKHHYCGSSWYSIGLEELTRPFSIAICGQVPRSGSHGEGGGMPPSPSVSSSVSWSAWVLLATVLFLTIVLRYNQILFVFDRRLAREWSNRWKCIVLFLVICLHSPSLKALSDPTEGKPFLPWLWNDQFVPTSEVAFDSSGQLFLLGGIVASSLAVNYDEDVREVIQRDRPLSTDLAHLGSFWGSGFPGIAIATTQLLVDPAAGLVHARALAFTSLSHVSLALVVRRPRPNQSENVSFPSGHTASAFATATVLGYTYGWGAGAPAFMLASLVGVSRLQDDVHFFSDVMAAAILGLFWGRASAHLSDKQKTPSEQEVSLLLEPWMISDGWGLSLRRNF